jgi:acyl-CoA dehydrogenase
LLARGRVHIAAVATGLARRALDESVAHAAQVRQGGVLIGDRQPVQAMLAEQQALVMAGTAMVRETARRYLDGSDRRIAPSATKLFCTEAAGRVADLAVQVHAAAGTCARRPWSGSTATSVCCGSTRAPAIQELIVGRELLKRELAK